MEQLSIEAITPDVRDELMMLLRRDASFFFLQVAQLPKYQAKIK